MVKDILQHFLIKLTMSIVIVAERICKDFKINDFIHLLPG